MSKRRSIDRPWSECPVGTKAHSVAGGHWIKLDDGSWQWPRGSSFPRPGGDALSVTLPEDQTATPDDGELEY